MGQNKFNNNGYKSNYPELFLDSPNDIEKHLSDSISLIATKGEQNLNNKIDLWRNSELGVIGWDWDGTITINGFVDGLGRNQSTIWQEIKTQLNFSAENIAEMKRHYERWGRSRSEQEQLDWSNATYEVYRREGVTREKLHRLADSLYLRPGAVELIKKIAEKGHHQCVISYGLKDLIEIILKKHGLDKIVSVFADSLAFDENGVITGADEAKPRIVPASKTKFLQSYIDQTKIKNPHKTVFIGDSVHDLQVIEATNGLGIYLHHLGHSNKDISHGALEEMVKEADIIALNQKDNTLEPVVNFVENMISLS